MKYIDLNAITEDDVRGKWEVQDRILSNHTEHDVFADVRIIEIAPNYYRSINGKERIGKWTVLREAEIIYNPQLKFYIEGHEVGNAIITRLRYDPVGNGNLFKLTLYFDTGLELVLHKLETRANQPN